MIEHTKPLLVIPVYKGGDFFKELLSSLSDAEHLFSNVVVSLNGDDSCNDERIIEESSIFQFKNLVILRTPKPLSSVRHTYFWTAYLKKNFHADVPVFLLCHDDILLIDNARLFFSQHDDLRGICVIGDWEIFADDNSQDTRIGSTFPPEEKEISVSNLLRWQNSASSSKKKFTNMSGIIVPLHVLASVAALYNFLPDGYGARLEYCLATSKHNKKIIKALPPMVRIREHATQQGKSVPKASGMADELRYRLWLCLNLKGEAFRSHCLSGPLRIQKTHSLLLKYIIYKIRNLFSRPMVK